MNTHEPLFDTSRNENEIVSLFESLLFVRLPDGKDAPELDEEMRKIIPDARGNKLLAGSYALNRIFRAWYQLTWGDKGWNEAFDGETMRQQHALHDADIGTGHAMLSVALSDADPAHPILLARLFDRATLAVHGGPFGYGLAKLDTELAAPVVAPNFDPDFRSFAQMLREMRMRAAGAPGARGMSDEEAYVRLFWKSCGARIMAPFTGRLSAKDAQRYADEAQGIFDFYAAWQLRTNEFITYDHISTDIWNILRRIDPELLPQEEVYATDMDDDSEQTSARAHATYVFYVLHHTMDSDVLFPLDRYFNAVEIVWQDKETYIHTLSMLYAMLSDGRTRVPFARIPKHDLVDRAVREAELATRTDRIERMWFNPCTCFRLLDRVHPFFAPR